MALVLLSVFGKQVPCESRFLVVIVLAFGAALASSFLGGTAAAKGKLPIPEIALREAIKKDASLWSQGKGQVQEYLGEIRRGEAGQDLQVRYVALLGRKPPKQFKG